MRMATEAMEEAMGVLDVLSLDDTEDAIVEQCEVIMLCYDVIGDLKQQELKVDIWRI
jgi:hypothetical protein